MSFMFNPHPYDDMSPINIPKISDDLKEEFSFSYKKVVDTLGKVIISKKKSVFAIDGVPTADFEKLVASVMQYTKLSNINIKAIDISCVYKSSDELYSQFKEYLPEDRIKDPVLLYGKLYKDKYITVFDEFKISSFIETIKEYKEKYDVVILYGQGSASEDLWPYIDQTIFLDVTPKQIMLRTIAGKYTNLGDDEQRTLKLIQRRIYYIDLELAVHLRKELMINDKLNYYISSDFDNSYTLVSYSALNEMLSSLANQPFRCKPVYLEGIWGGQYIKKVRKLPDTFNNAAWIFDLIPLEVSLLIQIDKNIMEIPYYTFIQMQGEKIMGKEITERFGGYFPIRFNYDDSFHANGNMSIQCHPGREFCMENYAEHGAQDEGYYVVATGHDAKTYCGFKDEIDPNEFMDLVFKSEKENIKIPYEEYIHGEESLPGKQFILPGGTIHASGRNQVVLEIGSLTVGSYTYKLYDYLRNDLDGKPRPIHSYYGNKVIAKDRNKSFVCQRLCKAPKLIFSNDSWSEYLVGEDPLVYYSCSHLKFDKYCEGKTAGKFHVLALVDGERVTVRSKLNPSFSYTLNYLDIVVVPAFIGEYEIINETKSPVIVYKVKVKD